MAVQATLNYINPQIQSPYSYVRHQPPEDVPAHNLNLDPHLTIVHDARDKENVLGLDTSGFQWVNYPSAEKEFADVEKIKTIYYAEVEDILKKHADAKRVFIYDYTIRKDPVLEADPAKFGRRTDRGPLCIVHADHTLDFAEQKVRRCLPDDAERLLKGRYQVINVWRPIASTVAHYPLGVLDSRSLDVAADLVLGRMVFPKSICGMYYVKHNPGHQWYYLSDQTPDEVLLFKCFDSGTDEAMLVVHSAFPDTTTPPNMPHRQSIEVRALVFDRV